MDTTAEIVTEALRLWRDECLSVEDALRLACSTIPASEAARQLAIRLVPLAVGRLLERRWAASLALAERLGGGGYLASEIDAWFAAHRRIRRVKIQGRPVPKSTREFVSIIEARIRARLPPDVWREFAPGLQVQQS